MLPVASYSFLAASGFRSSEIFVPVGREPSQRRDQLADGDLARARLGRMRRRRHHAARQRRRRRQASDGGRSHGESRQSPGSQPGSIVQDRF